MEKEEGSSCVESNECMSGLICEETICIDPDEEPFLRTDSRGVNRVSEYLLKNESLKLKQYILSSNKRYRLKLTRRGDLVLKDMENKRNLWKSKTKKKSVNRLTLQSKGNLVLLRASGKIVWESSTNNSFATELIVEDNGAVVLYKDNQKIWSINDSGSVDIPDDNDKPDDNEKPDNNTVKTVYTSASANDLDLSDRIDFKKELLKGGYKHVGDNKSTTLSEFNKLLGRTDIKTIYHGSHGSKGIVHLMDKDLTCKNSATYKVENVIYATCLTLDNSCWKEKMGSSSKNILGYTKVSFDGIANTNAKKFAQNINNGKSYIKAWYASNTSINQLKNRWCGYVREGSKIVEYSAKSGNSPRSDIYNVVPMDGNQMVLVNEELLNNIRDFSSSFSSFIDKNYEFFGNEEQEVRFIRNGEFFLSKQRDASSNSDVFAIVKERFGEEIPADAEFEGVSMIEADDQIVAHRVRFVRQKDGLNIRGNKEEHHIEFLVNNGEVVAISKLWPDKIENSGGFYESFVSVQDSVVALSEYLLSIVRKPIKIVSVNACIGNTSNGDMVPSHCFKDDSDNTWVVNASTGEILD